MIKIRDVALRALEDARAKKLIGHPLDAGINLFASNNPLEVIEWYKGDLSEFFIVSQCRVLGLSEKTDDSVSSEELEDFFAGVYKAKGEKCARCWHYSETTGNDSEFGDACERCVKVLKAIR
jgi:isoleucyl-tRNA synthetase